MRIVSRIRAARRHGLVEAARGVRRRVKCSSLFLDRADEQVRDWILRVQPSQGIACLDELRACTSPDELLCFAERHLGISQKRGEILDFVECVRRDAPQVLCEVGTLGGGTHFLMTRLIESLRHTVAVDLVVRNRAKLELLVRPGHRLHCIEGSSYAPTTVSRVTAALDGQLIDLLFIDGDHRYEGVKADFLAYRRLVREGGVIAFHDICEDYQSRFGRKTGTYAGGVPRFWQRLRGAFEHREFVEWPGQDGFGIGMIVHSLSARLPGDL